MAEPRPLSVNPEEALAFFRAKRFNLDPSFDWRDRKAQDHAWSFTVAKSTGFDVLADIHAAVDKAIAEGQSFESFRKELTPLLQAKGWWGRKDMVDPATGESGEVQLGSPRRLRTIFNTNLRMAMMAGKWQRMMRLREQRPWLRYVTVGDERVRRSHRSLHGNIYRWDNPFWDHYFPPNDFGCRCDVQQLSDDDLQREGFTPSPPDGWRGLTRSHINRRTGEMTQVPDGIMPGFEFNVGKLGLAANSGKLLMDRLAAMPPELAAQAGQAAQAFALSGVSYEFMGWVQAVIAGTATSSLRVAGTLTPQGLEALSQKPVSAAVVVTADDVVALQRNLPLADLLRLPHLLARPQEVYRNQLGELLYIYPPRADGSVLVLRLKPGIVSEDAPYLLTRILDATVFRGGDMLRAALDGLTRVSGNP